MRPTGPGRAPRLAAAAVAAALVAVVAPAAAHGACANTATAASAAATEQVREAVRCLVNAERAQHGLPALQASQRLESAAARHSADMVQRHFFHHVSPEGGTLTDRVRRAGYLSGTGEWALGENIGWGTGSLGSPAAIVRGWMNSPPHRAVILSRRFREAGVGVARGVPVGGDGATFTLDAGRR
jgi:uncharacterized protein YkwD